MKILLTGGHFSPAHALITEFKKRGHTIAVIGRIHPFEGDSAVSLEYLVAQKENLEFFELETGRVRRILNLESLLSLSRVPQGVLNAARIISSYKPDVIVTFGGYIAASVVLAAAVKGVKVVLHEQTQRAGIGSKIAAKVAKKICISFESSKKYFPEGKTILTGNPIRPEVFKIQEKMSLPSGKVIYITGGSTGSHRINEMVLQVLDALINDFVVIHQTGENEFLDYEILNQKVKELPDNLRKKYIIRKFIFPSEIGFILRNADLIISRSGANIISEILALEKMSLLLPLSHGQTGEQLENARLLENIGISEYIEEKDLTEEIFIEKIKKMTSNSAIYEKNMERASSYVISDAARKIADVVEKVYGG
ncbi:MAG: hypothetical protein A2776_00520 [Candidatus Levybacteria bacterium RIFCSPHIGHO2_01_FULL_40_10]|nr:MAG: hypothetical protein A2776_00520 [Candidatus Levybacteria bacterium RIFCSPHIGHO2_01_FULL_40_10]